ncbi:MAG TPA: transglycosylase domain-containing protein [Candidatus Paceibacterota bacterium]|nr:transglycosylase domain-containing protein [Candidatus Paceibacterota bacterium]
MPQFDKYSRVSQSPALRRRKGWRRLSIPQWLEVIILGIVVLTLFSLGVLIIWASLIPIPSISNFENRQVAQSTKIYDRTGNILLYDAHGAEQRTSVPLNEISPYLQDATIAIEDDTFYHNIGVRPLSDLRALWVDITSGGYVQGGSTITQQVVKNTLLTNDKTITRKIEEVILALRLTRAYSKDQILDTYLNESPYGGTIYGVQAASQYFFGVDASNVDLAQAAYIAALPQSPTYLSPYGNNRAALDTRKNLVLAQMKAQGYITDQQYQQAVNEQVQFKPESQGGVLAPHFVFYILQYLEQKYGVDEVQNGGLKVVTTLDYDLQQYAQNIITQNAANEQEEFNASNTSLVAIDPKTGQILAMIGSTDYFNNAIQGQYNDALSLRQPGSSFKPFVYATAFEKGYTPDTVVFDLQTQFSTSCAPADVANDTTPCFSPVNYDGVFHGPINLRDAIAISDNVASVKVLYLAGVAQSIQTAQSLGVTSLGDPSQYGLSLVLGAGEVSLLQMTGAYSVFANDGIKNPPTGILEVEDGSGNVLESYQNQATRVLDPQIAREINDVLSDNTARAPEFGVDGPLYFDGYDVADKTGTTDSSRDAWVLGYTPSIAIGEWAGNNDNSPMVKKIAAFIVAPIWHQIMLYALQKYSSPSDTFPPPAPNPNESSLPPVLQGNWNGNPSQGVHDILYWVQKDTPLAGPPANPYADPQTAYWDYPVQLWAAQNNYSSSPSVPTVTPLPVQQAPEPNFQITSPQSGTIVSSQKHITVTATAPSSVVSISYFLDGTPLGTATAPPYAVSFFPESKGPATLEAVAKHADGTTETRASTFTIQ